MLVFVPVDKYTEIDSQDLWGYLPRDCNKLIRILDTEDMVIESYTVSEVLDSILPYLKVHGLDTHKGYVEDSLTITTEGLLDATFGDLEFRDTSIMARRASYSLTNKKTDKTVNICYELADNVVTFNGSIFCTTLIPSSKNWCELIQILRGTDYYEIVLMFEGLANMFNFVTLLLDDDLSLKYVIGLRNIAQNVAEKYIGIVNKSDLIF